jgi:hypothetical protein
VTPDFNLFRLPAIPLQIVAIETYDAMSTALNEKLWAAIRPSDWRYSLLGSADNSAEAKGQQNQSPSISFRRRIAKIAALCVPFWLLLLYLNFQRPSVSLPSLSSSSSATEHTPVLSSQYFHFLIPAASGSLGFCRTLYTAGALNYPTPRIINWDKKFDKPDKLEGGFSVAKIDAVLDFLKKLGNDVDHELVYIVGGYDTWFQLRPEVLIQRYHAVNERARKVVWPRYGLKYRQTIVFSAQKHCEAGPDAWSCIAVPPSNLPADLYGQGTDNLQQDSINPYGEMRPRYLNSGSIIGPVGAMKALYEYAHSKTKDKSYTSDQEVFAEIFGEQEYYREMERSKNGRTDKKDAQDPRTGKFTGEMTDLHCEKCQFGIGLDYRGELGAPLIHSEVDYEHIEFGAYGAQKHKLAEDIRDSTPPFWTPDYSGETRLPRTSWGELALFSNRLSGVTPVTSSWPTASNTTESWHRMWYQARGHLRTLAEAHAKSFRVPFAVVHTDAKEDQEATITEYWGRNDGYGGARLHETSGLPGVWRQWDDLCGKEDMGQEIFGDGRGAFQCPVHYLYWNAEHAKSQLETWHQRKKMQTQDVLPAR